MTTHQSQNERTLTEVLERLRVYSRGQRINPHKYVLLLALSNLLYRQPSHPNRFTYAELEPEFERQFAWLFPDWPAERTHLEYPFYHLQSDGFWHLQLKAGKESAFRTYEQSRLTRQRLLETVDFAYLSGPLWDELKDESSKEIVRGWIMSTYVDGPDSATSTGRNTLSEQEPTYETAHADTSLFEHEAQAIHALREDVGAFGQLLSNVQVHDDQSNAYFEYDVILVSRSGIYVIELKHWSGRIEVRPNHWVLGGGRYPDDPHKTNDFKCKLLKGIYERRFPTLPNVWVESVVILTNPTATVENADTPAAVARDDQRHNLTFASLDDFATFLRKRDGSPAFHRLNKDQIGAIGQYLASLGAAPRSVAYQVPGFETVHYLYQSADRIELVARPTDGRTRGLKRFRVFRAPREGSPQDQQRARQRARNTIEAVDRIGEHPCVHRVWTIPNDQGDVIEGSDWSDAGTLADLVAERGGALAAEEALAICGGVARGLAAAHAAGIIHRAVKPANVLMLNGIPKLTNFDLSFQLDRRPGDATVLPDPQALCDDGYVAPELLRGDDFDEGADLFSVGVMAYELLTGSRPFEGSLGWAASGGRLRDEQVARQAVTGAPASAVEAIEHAVRADGAERLRDAQAMAEALLRRAAEEAEPNAVLEPGATYDLYRIVRLVGSGSEAQVYCAERPRGERVALKLFHREVPRERVFREQAVARAVDSERVVRSDGAMGHWGGQRFFLVMEYVEGESLRERMARGERPATEEGFREVSLGLMAGLEAFHSLTRAGDVAGPLVHGDVKPDNVLLTRQGGVKLSDFSVVGPPRIAEFAGTHGYVPPDRMVGAQMQFAPDGDLFALGVTLWEWCYGAKPYKSLTLGATPEAPERDAPAFLRRYRGWLERAVATRAEERFATVEAMRKAFLAAGLAEGEVIQTGKVTPPEPIAAATKVTRRHEVWEPATDTNPFVGYLNTLSNASAGNENATAEAQGSSPFFGRIYVPNPLTAAVKDALSGGERHLILTGNAGDGKTTIASEIYYGATGAWLPPERRVEVPDAGLVIVKDMSELPSQERARVLMEAAESRERFLVVTNTGTLLDSASQLRMEGIDRAEVESEILGALEADEMVPVLGGRFALLNVGRTDSIETACAVFERMLERENWLACETCCLGERCPLYRNVCLLREEQDRVVERVKLIYQRLYEYGVRLTMRQMTGHLAYALTAGRGCDDLRKLSDLALDRVLEGSLFFNRFFGDDGLQPLAEALQLFPVRQVQAAEFGVELEPTYERTLWARDDGEVPLTGQALDMLRRLKGSSGVVGPAARVQARRLLYFLGALEDAAGKRYLTTFLRSPMLLDYMKMIRGQRSLPGRWELDQRCRVMQVLQEFFTAIKLPEGIWDGNKRLHITLNRRDGGSSTQVVLASLPTYDFALVLEEGHQAVPGSSQRLTLTHKTGPRLPLDLPFLDFVARRYRGEVGEHLSAFYADRLQRFEAALLKQQGAPSDAEVLHLLRIGRGRELHPVRIEFDGDRMEVLS